MYSVLGQNTNTRMAQGGLAAATEIRIPTNVQQKIVQQMTEHKLKKISHTGNLTGGFEVETEYKLCYNAKFPDCFFVITEKISFGGDEINDTSYGVYCFDKNGDLEDFDERFTKGSFFRDMHLLSDI